MSLQLLRVHSIWSLTLTRKEVMKLIASFATLGKKRITFSQIDVLALASKCSEKATEAEQAKCYMEMIPGAFDKFAGKDFKKS